MLLFTGQEFEELGYGVQQYLRIAVVQVCSCQEIRTDHLQTVAAGFVSSQHQGRRVDRLLDHRNLALVDLEIDNFRRFWSNCGYRRVRLEKSEGVIRTEIS